MAHYYNGIDVPTSIVPAYTAGKGFFSIGQATDDLDDRDAAAAMALGESNRDCINWLTWRALNPIDGSVHTQTTLIDTANTWNFRGDAICFKRIVQSSSTGWHEKRPPLSAGVVDGSLTNAITPSHGDIWLLDTTITSGTALILTPLTGVTGVVEFILRRPKLATQSTAALPVYDTTVSGFNYVVSFTSGLSPGGVADSAATATILWDGTRYIVKSTFYQTPAITGATI